MQLFGISWIFFSWFVNDCFSWKLNMLTLCFVQNKWIHESGSRVSRVSEQGVVDHNSATQQNKTWAAAVFVQIIKHICPIVKCICSRQGGTVHWKQGYRGQFHILHWILLLFCSSGEIKVRIQYFKLVLIHFMSNVWLKAHFPQKSYVIWWKISIFDTKNLISRYFTTFHFPNYLNLQKMNKIQLYSYGEIQAKQI